LRNRSFSRFFFSKYNKVYGKKFRVLVTAGSAKANELVRKAANLYRKKQNRLN